MSKQRRCDEDRLQAMIEDVDGLEPRLSHKAKKKRKGKSDKPKYHPRQKELNP